MPTTRPGASKRSSTAPSAVKRMSERVSQSPAHSCRPSHASPTTVFSGFWNVCVIMLRAFCARRQGPARGRFRDARAQKTRLSAFFHIGDLSVVFVLERPHLKIVVTVKQVPDTNAEKTFDPATKRLNRSSIENVLNPFDEYAIEE